MTAHDGLLRAGDLARASRILGALRRPTATCACDAPRASAA